MPRPTRRTQIEQSSPFVCADSVVRLDAVRSARAALPGSEELGRLSATFAALADPTRLRILAALATGELCVCDLAAVSGTSESSVSHHLRQLRELDLVRPRREGRLVYYALDDDHVRSLLAQATAHVVHRAEPAQ